MSESWLDIAIIVFIVLSIGFITWRGGQANPESTGSLGQKVTALDRDVRSLSLQQSEYERNIGGIKSQIELIDRRAARIDDIHRVQEQLAAHDRKLDDMVKSQGSLQEAIAEHKSTSEHTCRQVDRLYDFIVEKGLRA